MVRGASRCVKGCDSGAKMLLDDGFVVCKGIHGEMLFTHSHRNLAAHQARQQQVARGAEFLVLRMKHFDLLEDWFG